MIDYIADRPIKIFLYGSRAKGTARPTSDVDVALMSHEKLSAVFMSNLRELIEESAIPYQVDLVDLAEVDEAFKQKILKEGLLWNA